MKNITLNPKATIRFMKSHWKIILIVILAISYIGKSTELDSLKSEPIQTIREEVKVPVEVIKEVEKTIEIVKTPQSCKDLIELDNGIINDIAIYFEDISASAESGDIILFLEDSTKAMEKLNNQVEKVAPERLKLVEDCNK
jgi:hypothetical protein